MATAARDLRPVALVVVGVVVTYLARATDFMSGPDEYNFRGLDRAGIWAFWMGQDRWAMGLSSLPLGQPVVPVVSLALGIALAAWAIWRYLTGSLGVTAWSAAVGTVVGVTAPALVFHTAWRTNCIGVGVGFVAAAEAVRLARAGGWRRTSLAVLLAAYAVGTYQAFAVVAGCMLLGVVMRHPARADLARALWLPTAGVVVSVVLGRALGAVTDAPRNGYGSHLLGGGGDPDALRTYVKTMGGAWTLVGVTEPWAGLALAVAVVVLVVTWAMRPRENLLRAGALVVLVLSPLLVRIFVDVPMRSELYWVVILAAVLALAVERLAASSRRVTVGVGVLCVLAVLGHAQVANAQYLAGQDTARLDEFFADRVLEAYRATPDPPADLTLVTVPCEWPRPPYWAGREYSQLGGLSSDPTQAAAMLRYHGLPVRLPTPSEVDRAQGALTTMPAFPEPGWFAIRDGIALARCGPELAVPEP